MSPHHISYYICPAVLTLFIVTATADSEPIIEYHYDGAGNIIGIQSDRNLGIPEITKLNPPFVNQDGSNTITATGTNLL